MLGSVATHFRVHEAGSAEAATDTAVRPQVRLAMQHTPHHPGIWTAPCQLSQHSRPEWIYQIRHAGAAGKGGYEQQQQAEAWQAYIAWERQNLQQQPPQQLAGRVSLAYECALTVLMHYPEACPRVLHPAYRSRPQQRRPAQQRLLWTGRRGCQMHGVCLSRHGLTPSRPAHSSAVVRLAGVALEHAMWLTVWAVLHPEAPYIPGP